MIFFNLKKKSLFVTFSRAVTDSEFRKSTPTCQFDRFIGRLLVSSPVLHAVTATTSWEQVEVPKLSHIVPQLSRVLDVDFTSLCCIQSHQLISYKTSLQLRVNIHSGRVTIMVQMLFFAIAALACQGFYCTCLGLIRANVICSFL